ncbi:hypothetical protein GLOTRDRAFT_63138 [Gloeophyllum trabeum ATCC 11539]|uniref:GST N-terminal domain-containing protein n=1 Tax=Gloeophyllum trabeum (strain ATCC 11539 / FP-39264 / Madison 617) TaxID=670483 RepID=S7Q0U7_GLOTA|nr:uncharacterized protein GLOTRDRAFT_63138 [Gloeophyllum trabeum ATCC 11539]EPQ53556.1 hypothetical protein GLOTRDRAFT_63138 [Gloeophyllum trabeum ATCC 11539]
MPVAQKRFTLYDLEGRTRPWSPHAFIVRMILNYKGVPYETIYISFPDIRPTIQKLDPNHEQYTIPFLVDHYKRVTVVDSVEIAGYLEAQCPMTPSVLPGGIQPLCSFWYKDFLHPKVLVPMLKLLLAPVCNGVLDHRGAEYWRRTREKRFGMRLEEMAGTEERWTQLWETIDPELQRIGRALRSNKHCYLLGSTPSYPDFSFCAALAWAQVADERLFKKILAAHPAIWQLWQKLSIYTGGP